MLKAAENKQEVNTMTNKDKKYRAITFRIPADLYDLYKQVLARNSQIPTYEIRNHMQQVVDADKDKSSKDA